ncbi:uncharacterized protein LOC119082286 isoform X2 [Bradysia coprophila]|uniref:uncharacterized protein LOC119082286 isoform X2 n=1 Tax=Bradysia coprophila TaxID=38358 RepID=UPI00187D99C7|nr:uncharacterized protein LOC119082286 isoform X2 [Bradysia coprophila]
MSTKKHNDHSYESSHKSHRSRITDMRYRSVTTSSSDNQTSKLKRIRLAHGRSPQHRSKRSQSRSCERNCCRRRSNRPRSCSRDHSHRRSESSSVSERQRSGDRQIRYRRRSCDGRSYRSRSHQRSRQPKSSLYRRHRRCQSRDRCCRTHRRSRYRSASDSSSDDQTSRESRSRPTKRRRQRSRRSRSRSRCYNHEQSPRSGSRCKSRYNKAHRSRRSSSWDRRCTTCNGGRSITGRTSSPSGGLVSKLRKSICEKSTQTDYGHSFYPINPAYPIYQDTRIQNDYSLVLPDLTDYAFLDPLIADPFLDPLADSRFEWQNTSVSGNFNDVNQTQPTDDNGTNMDNVTNSKESLPDVVANQQLNTVCRVEIKRLPLDMEQLRKMIQTPKVENINPEWHSLNEKMDCKICSMCFNSQSKLVKHYVMRHPTDEIFPSRVTPIAAELLRSSVHQCKRIKSVRTHRSVFEQFCYFCNQIKILTRFAWSNHLASHTGCFEFPYYGSVCESGPQFEWANVRATLCDLCNYVRFSETDMENHLKNEHGRDATNNFKEVTFLRFMLCHGDRWRVSGQLIARVNWFKSPLIKQLKGDDSSAIVKNNNPEWHCLNKEKGCRICGSRDSTVGHYVNVHPNTEVVVSRLDPSVAMFLRSLLYSPKCKVVGGVDRQLFEQYCYFCNKSQCFSKHGWIEHIIRHTGYYNGQCCSNMLGIGDCSRCKGKRTRLKSVHQFNGRNLTGYLCDLCNFIRFDRTEIQNHLRNEHDGNNGIDDFEEVVFLTFPDCPKRRSSVANIPSIVADEPLPLVEKMEGVAATNVELTSSVGSQNEDFGEGIISLVPAVATGEFNG